MNFYTRGQMLYIDISTSGGRIRQSTALQDTPKNREYCLKNKDLFLSRVLSAKAAKESKALKASQAKQSRAKAKTLKEAIKELLALANGLKPTTQESYKTRYNVIFRAICGSKNDIKLKDIDSSHIANFYQHCLEQAYSKTQIASLCQVIRRIFTHCIQKGYIAKSPFYTQRITTATPKAEPKPLSLEEVQTLLLSCSHARFYAYLTTAFFSGMRCGELYALKWEDIHFHNDEIHINATLTQKGTLQAPKTASSKRVIDMLPLVKDALLVLKNQTPKAEPKDFVFINEPKKDMRTYRAMWEALLAQCGLEKRVLYSTRHTFASIMLSKGEDPLWVGCRMLGHKDLSITFENYARYIKSKQERATFLKHSGLGKDSRDCMEFGGANHSALGKVSRDCMDLGQSLPTQVTPALNSTQNPQSNTAKQGAAAVSLVNLRMLAQARELGEQTFHCKEQQGGEVATARNDTPQGETPKRRSILEIKSPLCEPSAEIRHKVYRTSEREAIGDFNPKDKPILTRLMKDKPSLQVLKTMEKKRSVYVW